jgi:hypothetical protein
VSAFDALFDAHLAAFYPGPYGGKALSKVLRGEKNPSARLPITMHAADMQALPYWRAPSDYTTIPPALTYERCAQFSLLGLFSAVVFLGWPPFLCSGLRSALIPFRRPCLQCLVLQC